MSSTGIKEDCFDYALFYNNFTCLSDINCSGLSVYNSINNLYGLSGTTLLNANNLNVSGTSNLNGNTTCISSLNVSGISNLSTTTINGHFFALQNIYGQLFQPSFDVAVPNKALNLNTRGNGNLNLNSFGGKINFYISGLNIISMANNATTCMSSVNISGITTLNNNVTLGSTLNVSGITILNKTLL